MKIEKLNENKIKITLSLADLEERNIDLQSFIYNSPESQDLFWDMMNEAEKEYGFDVNESMIYVEASSGSGGSFTLIVTKTDEPSFIQKAKQKDTIKRAGYKLKRKKIQLTSEKSLYMFESFDDVCDYCKVIDVSSISENSLYKLGDEYYLEITAVNPNQILDFADIVKNSDICLGKINEYGNVVIENDAMQKLSKCMHGKRRLD